jgi:hypothetical protein
MHCASLGESKVLLRLAADLPPEQLVLTATTSQGVAAIRRHLPQARVFFLPIDHAPVMRQFLETQNVAAAIFIESEMWPACIQELTIQKIPLSFVGLRLQTASLRRWQRLAKLFPGWTQWIDTVWTDQPETVDVAKALGFPNVKAGQNWKWLGAVPQKSHPNASECAAISIHWYDLFTVLRFRNQHVHLGCHWFPRQLWLAHPLGWVCRLLQIPLCPTHRLPKAGEVCVWNCFGKVAECMPRCQRVWVSALHDQWEPLYFGAQSVWLPNGFEQTLDPNAIPDNQIIKSNVWQWIRNKTGIACTNSEMIC